jgi:DNA modification methylase
MAKKDVSPKIETKKLSDLTPDPENANEGSDRGRQLLDESIDKFGFLSPGVIDASDTTIIGNKRAEAAKNAGMDDAIIIESDGTVPVYIRRTDLDLSSEDPEVAARTRAAAYYDNWTGFQSIRLNPIQVETDLANPTLAPMLNSMMTQKERVRLGVQLDKPDPVSNGDAPPPISAAQQTYAVRPGDVWQLGRHILACGDSTDHSLLQRLLSAPPEILITSPPYGVGKDYEEGGVSQWQDLIQRSLEAWSLSRINTLAINLGDRHTGNEGWELHTFGQLVTFALDAGYSHLNTRVWTKQPAWSQTPYWRTSFKTVDEFEYIAVFAREKPSYKARLTDEENNEWGYRSVWDITSVQSNDIHTAMFPIELPMRLIRLHTDQNQTVFEPFSGSGTTIIAAEAMRRSCVAVELLPEYCAVALARFAEVTQIEPERVYEANDTEE